MKKIWAIEQGEYSDYGVVGVFSTQENAEYIAQKINNNPDNFGRGKATIVEWILDPGISELRSGRKPYHILMDITGNTEEVYEEELNAYRLTNALHLWERSQAPAFKKLKINDAITGTVWAYSKEHAIKSTNEFRIRTIAERLLQVPFPEDP